MYLIVYDRLFVLICRLLDNLNIIAVGVIKLQMPHHRQDQVSCVYMCGNPKYSFYFLIINHIYHCLIRN